MDQPSSPSRDAALTSASAAQVPEAKSTTHVKQPKKRPGSESVEPTLGMKKVHLLSMVRHHISSPRHGVLLSQPSTLVMAVAIEPPTSTAPFDFAAAFQQAFATIDWKSMIQQAMVIPDVQMPPPLTSIPPVAPPLPVLTSHLSRPLEASHMQTSVITGVPGGQKNTKAHTDLPVSAVVKVSQSQCTGGFTQTITSQPLSQRDLEVLAKQVGRIDPNSFPRACVILWKLQQNEKLDTEEIIKIVCLCIKPEYTEQMERAINMAKQIGFSLLQLATAACVSFGMRTFKAQSAMIQQDKNEDIEDYVRRAILILVMTGLTEGRDSAGQLPQDLLDCNVDTEDLREICQGMQPTVSKALCAWKVNEPASAQDLCVKAINVQKYQPYASHPVAASRPVLYPDLTPYKEQAPTPHVSHKSMHPIKNPAPQYRDTETHMQAYSILESHGENMSYWEKKPTSFLTARTLQIVTMQPHRKGAFSPEKEEAVAASVSLTNKEVPSAPLQGQISVKPRMRCPAWTGFLHSGILSSGFNGIQGDKF